MSQKYCIVTLLCIILEIVACVLVWRNAGGDHLQYTLSRDIRRHVEQRNYDDFSRRFLELIQLKVSFFQYMAFNECVRISSNAVVRIHTSTIVIWVRTSLSPATASGPTMCTSG